MEQISEIRRGSVDNSVEQGSGFSIVV